MYKRQAPGVALPTVLLTLARDGHSAASLEAHFRALDTPVIARIVDDRIALDLRTVPADSLDQLGTLLEW